MTDSKQTFATLKELIRMHSVQTSRQALIIRSMWQFAAFPKIKAIRKAGKHQNNNLFFKSALLISTVSTSAFQSTNLLLFASHHISTLAQLHFFHINTRNPQFLHPLRRKASARNVSFVTFYGGQFMLSTQLIILNYPVILSHRRSTTVSLETYPLFSS